MKKVNVVLKLTIFLIAMFIFLPSGVSASGCDGVSSPCVECEYSVGYLGGQVLFKYRAVNNNGNVKLDDYKITGNNVQFYNDNTSSSVEGLKIEANDFVGSNKKLVCPKHMYYKANVTTVDGAPVESSMVSQFRVSFSKLNDYNQIALKTESSNTANSGNSGSNNNDNSNGGNNGADEDNKTNNNVTSDIETGNNQSNDSDEESVVSEGCAALEPLIGDIETAWDIIKIAAPILVIVFGSLDFAQALISNDNDNLKKATNKFGKRLIFAGAIFFLPYLVDLLFTISGLDEKITSVVCGIR